MSRQSSTGFSFSCAVSLAAIGLSIAPVQASAAATVNKPATAARTPGGPGSLSGVWFNEKFSATREPNLPEETPRTRSTADRQPIPYQPWARAEVEKRQNSFKTSRPFSKLSASCIPGGTPQMMQPPPQLPLEIIETPDQKQITILFESMSTFRIIRMDEQHPEDPDPTFFGNSVGHWEGDTLVVDTIAIKEVTTIDDIIPHSDQLRVVERFKRTGPDTLEVLATIHDPKTFSKPYTYRFPFKHVPGQKIREFICENNRNEPDETGATTVKLQGGGQ